MQNSFSILTAIGALFFNHVALAEYNQLGASVSVPAGISVTYDKLPGINRFWSLGGEVAGVLDDYFYIAGRGFYWQFPDSLSGLYGGPKVGLAIGKKLGAAVGGEGGWMYRFDSQISLGAAFELWASYGAYGGIRLNFGYKL